MLALGTGALICASPLAAALGPAAGEASAPAFPPPGRIVFDVMRAGVVVGSHIVEMASRAGRFEVRNAIDIDVSVLGVELYRFKQRSLEVWSPSRLTSFESETTEDDASFWVKGRALTDGFDVENRKEHHTAPADIMVAAYWRPEICEQQQLIEPKKGRLRDQTLLATRRLTIPSAGGEIPAEEFRITGILDGACTYDERGRWIGAWFDKQGRIEYRVAS